MAKYEVRLVGEHAELGDVPAVDVARLILDVQTAVARAAGAFIRRPPKRTGRWEGTLEDATKLRLVEVTQGTVRIGLQPPRVDGDEQFELEVDSLADAGWSVAAGAIEGPIDEADTDVLVRLLTLANDLSIGNRFEAVEFRTNDALVARLDGGKRARIRAAVESRRNAFVPLPDVTGVLFEADFERHTAKVRTQEGDVVELFFEEDQANSIQDALRERSQFVGDVTFDAVTSSVKSVRLREITRFEQLLLGDEGARAFWRPVTFDSLAEEQGTQPVDSFDELRDTSLSDEEFQQFIDTLS
ncbi:MAG: hypothetical protein M3121_00970 [Chloroflexota bacterium]|nr:hypothetical protein [Chloroflexota bacterium]